MGQNVVLTAEFAPVDKTLSLYDGDVESFMDRKSVGEATVGSSTHYAIHQMYGLPAGEHVFSAQYRGESFAALTEPGHALTAIPRGHPRRLGWAGHR